MYGTIFVELKKFVETGFGPETWTKIHTDSGVKTRIFLATSEYPDEEIVQLVTTASRLSGIAANKLLTDFGKFIAPDLVAMYKSYIHPDWKAMDFLEKTEEHIHKVVRVRNPGAKPPELKVERKGPNEVLIRYASARKMCDVAKGIVQGVSDHYKEPLLISESQCMHNGASECHITVKKA